MITNFIYNLIIKFFKEFRSRGLRGFFDYLKESGKDLVIFFYKNTDFFTLYKKSEQAWTRVKLNGIILYRSTVFSLLSITYRVYFYSYLWVIVLIILISYLFYFYILSYILFWVLVLFYIFLFLIFVVYRSTYIYRKYKNFLERSSLKVIIVILFFILSQFFIIFSFYSLYFDSFMFFHILDIESSSNYNLLKPIFFSNLKLK